MTDKTYRFVNFYLHLGIGTDEDRLSARRKIVQALFANHPDKHVHVAEDAQKLVAEKTCILNDGKEIFSNDTNLGAWRYKNSSELNKWQKGSIPVNVNGTGFFDPVRYLTWQSKDAYFFDIKKIQAQEKSNKAKRKKEEIQANAQEQRQAKAQETKARREKLKAKVEERSRKAKSRKMDAKTKHFDAMKNGPSTRSRSARNLGSRSTPIVVSDFDGGSPACRTRSRTYKSGTRPGVYGPNLTAQFESIPGYDCETRRKQSAEQAAFDAHHDGGFSPAIKDRVSTPY